MAPRKTRLSVTEKVRTSIPAEFRQELRRGNTASNGSRRAALALGRELAGRHKTSPEVAAKIRAFGQAVARLRPGLIPGTRGASIMGPPPGEGRYHVPPFALSYTETTINGGADRCEARAHENSGRCDLALWTHITPGFASGAAALGFLFRPLQAFTFVRFSAAVQHSFSWATASYNDWSESHAEIELFVRELASGATQTSNKEVIWHSRTGGLWPESEDDYATGFHAASSSLALKFPAFAASEYQCWIKISGHSRGDGVEFGSTAQAWATLYSTAAVVVTEETGPF